MTRLDVFYRIQSAVGGCMKAVTILSHEANGPAEELQHEQALSELYVAKEQLESAIDELEGDDD